MTLQENDVLIYTTPLCPYCQRAKELLLQKGAKFKEIDVSDPSKRLALVEKAGGRKTVPQIFIRNQHIGGYDDLKALDDKGELDQLLS
jgi:glutaredoxin 3